MQTKVGRRLRGRNRGKPEAFGAGDPSTGSRTLGRFGRLAELREPRCQLPARADAELGVRVREMELDGVDRDDERCSRSPCSRALPPRARRPVARSASGFPTWPGRRAPARASSPRVVSAQPVEPSSSNALVARSSVSRAAPHFRARRCARPSDSSVRAASSGSPRPERSSTDASSAVTCDSSYRRARPTTDAQRFAVASPHGCACSSERRASRCVTASRLLEPRRARRAPRRAPVRPERPRDPRRPPVPRDPRRPRTAPPRRPVPRPASSAIPTRPLRLELVPAHTARSRARERLDPPAPRPLRAGPGRRRAARGTARTSASGGARGRRNRPTRRAGARRRPSRRREARARRRGAAGWRTRTARRARRPRRAVGSAHRVPPGARRARRAAGPRFSRATPQGRRRPATPS